MSLKKQLIKLGSTNPNLRNHIREILGHLRSRKASAWPEGFIKSVERILKVKYLAGEHYIFLKNTGIAVAIMDDQRGVLVLQDYSPRLVPSALRKFKKRAEELKRVAAEYDVRVEGESKEIAR